MLFSFLLSMWLLLSLLNVDYDLSMNFGVYLPAVN